MIVYECISITRIKHSYDMNIGKIFLDQKAATDQKLQYINSNRRNRNSIMVPS